MKIIDDAIAAALSPSRIPIRQPSFVDDERIDSLNAISGRLAALELVDERRNIVYRVTIAFEQFSQRPFCVRMKNDNGQLTHR
jgi:hypothetical protein